MGAPAPRSLASSKVLYRSEDREGRSEFFKTLPSAWRVNLPVGRRETRQGAFEGGVPGASQRLAAGLRGKFFIFDD